MNNLDRELFLLTLGVTVLLNILVLRIPWIYSLILGFFLTLGIYAFKGFEMENLSSINTLFVNDFIGSIASGLAFLILYPLFRPHVNKYDLIFAVIMVSSIVPIVSHIVFRNYLKRVPPKRYLVIGRKEELQEIADEIRLKTFGKVIFQDYVNPSPSKLLERVKSGEYDALLIADPKLAKEVERCILDSNLSINVEHLPSVVEKCIHRIPIEVMKKFSEYYTVFFENVKGDSPAKRIVDVFVSILAIAIFSPLMLLISIAILLEDGPPVIFKQRRIGKNGVTFTLHKFRSMSEKGKGEVEDAQRITNVGKFIRLYRLDELPQFFDILSGKMSVVGPRPEQEESGRIFEKVIPFYKYRYLVKPGLTGWAQINYKHSRSLEETAMKLSYDLWYVKNRTIFVDLRIILQTLETMIFRRGAK